MCSKLDFHIPGVTTIPDLVAKNKSRYYQALEAADEACDGGSTDVSAMETLMKDLLAKQMLLALERAEAPLAARQPNLTEPPPVDARVESRSPKSKKHVWLVTGVAVPMVVALIALIPYWFPRPPEESASSVGLMDCSEPMGVNIADGRITIPKSGCYKIHVPEANSATDLMAINCESGDIFILQTADADRVVIIKAWTAAAFSLNHPDDKAMLLCGDGSTVTELSRANGSP